MRFRVYILAVSAAPLTEPDEETVLAARGDSSLRTVLDMSERSIALNGFCEGGSAEAVYQTAKNELSRRAAVLFGESAALDFTVETVEVTTFDRWDEQAPGIPGVYMSGADIARYTGRSTQQVSQKIVSKPGFPTPISDLGGRSKLWPEPEAKAFLDEWLADREIR
ncbi:helix-turn-helix transcriptional regulator [Glycomyces buryatensis]|uniref:helix-turn-helix transcriptional regulator n=1 Tax=Glycomyces buryatensis TaxID=2570927 RepID=UPI0014562B51|nr:hypothetical protein [Glycomyces buryatensis]